MKKLKAIFNKINPSNFSDKKIAFLMWILTLEMMFLKYYIHQIQSISLLQYYIITLIVCVNMFYWSEGMIRVGKLFFPKGIQKK